MNTAAPPYELQAIEKLREDELEEARAIQSMMMPSEALRAGAVTTSRELQPLAAVGGDYLDYFELTDGSVGLYLGDVSGKGLPGRAVRGAGGGTLRGVQKTGTLPHDVLATLNRRLMIRGMPWRHSAIQLCGLRPRQPRAANCQRRHASGPLRHRERRNTNPAIATGRFRALFDGRGHGCIRSQRESIRNRTAARAFCRPAARVAQGVLAQGLRCGRNLCLRTGAA